MHTKEEIIEAINNLFADKSVDLDEALDRQIEIRDAADMNVSALRDDIRRRDEGES